MKVKVTREILMNIGSYENIRFGVELTDETTPRAKSDKLTTLTKDVERALRDQLITYLQGVKNYSKAEATRVVKARYLP